MTQEISLGTTIGRADDVLDTKVDDTIVLLSTATGNYIELNRTSSAIWSMIDGKNTISAIVDDLIGVYEVDRAECELQVREFVGKLLGEKLVLAN